MAQELSFQATGWRFRQKSFNLASGAQLSSLEKTGLSSLLERSLKCQEQVPSFSCVFVLLFLPLASQSPWKAVLLLISKMMRLRVQDTLCFTTGKGGILTPRVSFFMQG